MLLPRHWHGDTRGMGAAQEACCAIGVMGAVHSTWIMSFVPDVTAHVPDAPKNPQMLREQAERCRRLAAATTDRAVSGKLLELAAEFGAPAEAEKQCSRCP